MAEPSPTFALCADYVERAAAADPLMATYDGVGGHDDESSDLSPAGHTARADVVRDTLHRLGALRPMTPADVLAADHLRERLQATLAWHDADVDSEVTRYFGWPAQAPSYKLGERAWLEARAEAQARGIAV